MEAHKGGIFKRAEECRKPSKNDLSLAIIDTEKIPNEYLKVTS